MFLFVIGLTFYLAQVDNCTITHEIAKARYSLWKEVEEEEPATIDQRSSSPHNQN